MEPSNPQAPARPPQPAATTLTGRRDGRHRRAAAAAAAAAEAPTSVDDAVTSPSVAPAVVDENAAPNTPAPASTARPRASSERPGAPCDRVLRRQHTETTLMGCIYTKVCESDEGNEFLKLHDDKSQQQPHRLTRTATTLLNLDPIAVGGGPKHKRSRSLVSTNPGPAHVTYGGGIPGVALDDETVASSAYTGAIAGGYSSTTGKLRWGAHTRAGNDPLRRRKENQDSFCIADCLADEPTATFFSVFDGHGPEGAHVSHFCREVYHQSLATAYKELILQPKTLATRRASVGHDVMAETFQRASHAVSEQLRATSIDASVSGTTAVSLLVCDRDLFVSNIGDSRAIVAVYSETDGRYVIHHETKDHKPDLPEERQRIESQNGRVFEWGTFRVWLKDVDMPGLAMSRSFGDAVAKTVGVTADPDVTYVDRVVHGNQEHPSFAILASDGVWEFLSSDECLAFVSNCIVTSKMDPQETCDALVAEACERWNSEEDVVDDITAIVVFF